MQFKRLFCISAICGLLFLVWHLPAIGGIPHLINYQGKLTDGAGNPLNGNYNLTFKIYNVENGGSVLWSETQNGVAVSDGIFSVILGAFTAMNLPFDSQYWLEVMVGAETIAPRRRLTSIGYSFRAQMADTAAFTLSYPAHNHDERYYTETELNTSDGNPPNTGSNRVNWNNITDMPIGFVDGVDNVGGASDTAKFAWRADSLDGHNWGDIYPNADMVDNYHAGNSSGQVAVSNGILCSSLNADKLDSYDAGNSSGQIPVSNGSLCSNLNSDKWDNYNWGDIYPNADKVDNYHAGNSSGQVAVSNGSLCSNLNADIWDNHNWGDMYPDADKLDGRHASEFVDLNSSQTISGHKTYTTWVLADVPSSTVGFKGIGGNGVMAHSNHSAGTYPAVFFHSYNDVASNSGIWGYGSIGCTGTKSSFVNTSQGKEPLFAIESPDVEFYASGTDTLAGGERRVIFERLFAEAISPSFPVRVIATPNADCNGLFVASSSWSGFVIRELRGGTSNASFSWIAIGRRKGYEARPVVEVPKEVSTPKGLE
jgi:hypothetical protein